MARNCVAAKHVYGMELNADGYKIGKEWTQFCLRCGHTSHTIATCYAKTDIWGCSLSTFSNETSFSYHTQVTAAMMMCLIAVMMKTYATIVGSQVIGPMNAKNEKGK